MRKILPENLLILAENCSSPLYVVGGSVRDYLADLTPKNGVFDFDLSSPMPVETFLSVAEAHGFLVRAVYKNTGTVKLRDTAGNEYEYSRFRSDEYVRGVHVPAKITFTNDVLLDARRRDFTANAVYYDVKKGEYVDPLQGIPAIREKRLSTVAPAEKVFSEDGLRLMRLARQSATLGFTPDEECLFGATKHAELLQDIAPERIFTELTTILSADEKYGENGGHYQGLRLLNQTRVLDFILPELTLGRDMPQRADFHKYDVLEHSLRAVYYAPPRIRLSALLHDVGKPYCINKDGNSYAHPEEGARLTRTILTRLKAPKKTIEVTALLVALHMYDFDCKTKENKLRRFFALHAPVIENLLLLKQADFSACTDDTSPAPTCVRWKTLLEKLREEHAPLSLKELAISGKDLLEIGIPPSQIATTLQALLLHAVVHPQDNAPTRLKRLAQRV